MYKKSGGYIGYNTPRLGGGNSPGGVYTNNDVLDSRKGALNVPRESIHASGWEDLSNNNFGNGTASDDPHYNMVSAVVGDPEFLYGANTDETDAWTEQIEWPAVSRGDFYGQTVTSFYHPANRFFSRRFNNYRNSYMDVAHRNNQNFGTGPFTIEFWFRRVQETAENHHIISKGSASGPTGFTVFIQSDYQLVINVAGTSLTTTMPTTSGTTGVTTGFMKDVWYHIAIVREGTGTNETKIYINGQRHVQGTLSGNATPSGQDTMYVGADRSRTSGATRGSHYVADLRISNTAVYTSNFACVSNVLPVTANTVFMLPIDSEPLGHGDQGSSLAPGGANITTIFAVYNDTEVPIKYTRPANIAAIWFNSNADYLVTNTASTDYVVGNGEFTFETWFYTTTFGANITPIMVSQHGGGANAGQIIGIYQNYLGNGAAVIYPNNAGTGNVIVQNISDEPLHSNVNHRSYSVSTAKWHHMAVTRDSSNTLRVFLDGNLKHSNAGVTFNQSHQNRIWINSDPTTGRGMHLGWIAESHIANVCLYTANFTPNVLVAPVRSGNTLFALRGNVHLDWANAAGRGANLATTVALDTHTTIGGGRLVSLCRHDGQMSPYKADPMRALIPDSVYDADRLEERGILSYQKYASVDTEFRGVSAYGAIYQSLKSADTSLQFGTGAFTFEVWVNPMGTTEYGEIFGLGAHASTGFTLGYGLTNAGNGTDKKVTFEHGSTEVVASDMPLRMFAWNHVAVVRQGTGTNQSNIFVNGYLAHTFTCATNITAASSPFYIGNSRSPSSASQVPMRGMMCMLRLSNTARYTSTGVLKQRIFTPPTTPFTSDANTRLLMFQYMGGGVATTHLDLGSLLCKISPGDYNYGHSAINPANNVNWSWGERDRSGDLSIWTPNSTGTASNGNYSDFEFGTGDFSFEFFYKPHRNLYGISDTKETFWSGMRNAYPDEAMLGIMRDSNDVLTVFFGNGAGSYNEIKASSRTRIREPDQWYHCVVQRVNGLLAVYVNGIREQEVTFTTNINVATYDTNIKFLGGSAVRQGNFSYPVNGYVSNFRILKGAAAYGRNGYNPLHIPIPTKPLNGLDPNCVFLFASGPSLKDYARNSRYWGWGGYQIRWSAWDRVNDASRSGYSMVPYGPFPEPVKHWRNHNMNWHAYNIAGMWIGEYDNNTTHQSTTKTSWIGGEQLPFTIEFWVYMEESVNSGVNILDHTVLSSSHDDNTAGRGGSFEIKIHSTSNTDDYGGVWCGIKHRDSNFFGVINGGNQCLGGAKAYSHIIWQFDPSVTNTNRHVIWVNGIRRESRTNGGYQGYWGNSGHHWNSIRATGAVSDLRISQCARYNPYATRLDSEEYNNGYGVMRRAPNQYYKVDKMTAILPVTFDAFKRGGATPCWFGVAGAGVISKAVTNTKLPGSRASMFFGQNSSQNSGGYWGATTPPWGFQSIPTHLRINNSSTPGLDTLNQTNASYTDWTFEGWFSWAGSASPTEKQLFEFTNNWSMKVVSGNIFFRTSNSDTYQRTTGVALASSSSNRVFQHIVFQRRNGSYEIFIDGVLRLSHPSTYWISQWANASGVTWQENATNYYADIGMDASGTNSQCWLGNLQDVRFTDGIARYQSGVVNVNGTPTSAMVYANTDRPVLAVHGGSYTSHFLANTYNSGPSD